jgi:uncharacterized membrane protein
LVVIIPAVIMTLVMYASMIAVFFASMDSKGKIDDSVVFKLYGTMMIEGVVLGLGMGCLHALIMFSYPLLVERNLSGMEAFKLSAKAVWQNLGGVVGLIIAEFLLGLIGYFACVIGIYFTFPIMFAGVFVAYRRVFPKVDSAFNMPPMPSSYNL